jgi:putative pyruvate formate lyase activating enzyme
LSWYLAYRRILRYNYGVSNSIKGYYEECRLCPRCCGVNRVAGERGFCGESAALRVASASIHHGEEPPITRNGGSGTIFITGCNLHCVFCQNFQISRGPTSDAMPLGREVSTDTFAAISLALQTHNAENINIVTGSHAVPAIRAGIDAAKQSGLTIPVLWNSSGYETRSTLELLEPVIDAYLPDLKTLDTRLAERFFNAPDYPAVAVDALETMMALRPGKVMIRHLVLPGYIDATREVLRWFAERAQGRASLSLMTQYTPVDAGTTDAPNRFVNKQEYETVLGYLDEFGIEDGYYQELENDSEWLPDFTRTNPFPSTLSVPVWHWASGEVGA